MNKEAFSPLDFTKILSPLIKKVPDLVKYKSELSAAYKGVKASTGTGTGVFKGVDLTVPNLTNEIKTLATQNPVKVPLFSGKGIAQRLLSTPATHINEIQTKGITHWAKNQVLDTIYHTNPVTGVVKRRALGGTIFSGVLGGGAVGGVGMGVMDLAAGEHPGKALRTAVTWGLAPELSFTGSLGQMGYNLLR